MRPLVLQAVMGLAWEGRVTPLVALPEVYSALPTSQTGAFYWSDGRTVVADAFSTVLYRRTRIGDNDGAGVRKR